MRSTGVAASVISSVFLVLAASFALAQDPCDHVVCPTDQVCSGGTCLAKCGNVLCPKGQMCSGGQCMDMCGGVVCAAGESCAEAACRTNYRLEVSPTDIDFDSEWMTYPCTGVVTLANTGAYPITINKVVILPSIHHPTSPFSITMSQQLPVALSYRAQVQVEVRYAPTHVGQDFGSVSIALDPSSYTVNPVALKGSGVQAPKRTPDAIVISLARSLSFSGMTQPDWASFRALFSSNAEIDSQLSSGPMTVDAFRDALLQLKPKYQSALFEPVKATILLRGGCGQDHSIAGEFTIDLVEQTKSKLGQSQTQKEKAKGSFQILQDSGGLIKRLEVTKLKKL